MPAISRRSARPRKRLEGGASSYRVPGSYVVGQAPLRQTLFLAETLPQAEQAAHPSRQAFGLPQDEVEGGIKAGWLGGWEAGRLGGLGGWEASCTSDFHTNTLILRRTFRSVSKDGPRAQLFAVAPPRLESAGRRSNSPFIKASFLSRLHPFTCRSQAIASVRFSNSQLKHELNRSIASGVTVIYSLLMFTDPAREILTRDARVVAAVRASEDIKSHLHSAGISWL